MNWLDNLRSFHHSNLRDQKGYSQYGEEVVIKYIFDNIGVTNKFCVDFGAGDGYWLSNSRALLDNGWTGLLMEGSQANEQAGVVQEHITAENINSLFGKYDVPHNFDLLSIDIDGNDLWVWKAIEYTPRVVVIEFNGTIGRGISKTIKYNPEHVYRHNDYYGASFEALKKLGKEKGYTLVHELASTNMFFILTKLVDQHDCGVTYSPNQYHKPAPPPTDWVEY